MKIKNFTEQYSNFAYSNQYYQIQNRIIRIYSIMNLNLNSYLCIPSYCELLDILNPKNKEYIIFRFTITTLRT